MNRLKRYSPEVRERAVRMVFEHKDEYSSRFAAISSIAQVMVAFIDDFRREYGVECTTRWNSGERIVHAWRAGGIRDSSGLT